MHRVRAIRSCLVLTLLAAAAAPLFAWGLEGHRTVNLNGVRSLPMSMHRFRDIDYYFADRASAVDRRKVTDEEETYRQFIELERYPEFAAKAMPRTLLDLQKKYSASSVRQNGYLPYLVYEMYDSVMKCMKRRDWEGTIRAAADLGHYVGDMTMPFNTTMNYDGQLTRNNGIKWRYEIELMNRYVMQMSFQRTDARKLDNPMNDIFALLAKSFSRVPLLLRADTVALRAGKGRYNSGYYSVFWREAGKSTNELMQDGANLFANLLYTAWLGAGAQRLVWPDEERPEGTFHARKEFEYLEPPFPNPFNPKTTIKYTLTDEHQVQLGVFNLFGQEVASFVQGRQTDGRYEFTFNGDQLPGGVYFVRLQVDDRTETRKIILSK
ncbi:MAG: T9SS type A sorting domain-containing protein [Bacteroidetes bacterium]|nr:MAG: T9SS type A sorting domain-containing protein [Bacteroidota bacterium]